MLKLKTYKRVLEIDFDNKTYRDYTLTRQNWQNTDLIVSTINYEQTKKELRKSKFKRIKGAEYGKGIRYYL